MCDTDATATLLIGAAYTQRLYLSAYIYARINACILNVLELRQSQSWLLNGEIIHGTIVMCEGVV